MKACKSVSYGKLDAVNSHVRFDAGEDALVKPQTCSAIKTCCNRVETAGVVAFLALGLATTALATATAPQFIADKAVYWADMSETSAISGDGGATLSQWRDVRETAAANATPTLYYATPAWTNGGETASVSLAYWGTNPAIETMGSAQRKTLNFHGRSGIYLRLQKDGAPFDMVGVRHFFAVHNPSNWFGSVIGEHTVNRTGALFLYPSNESYVYKMTHVTDNTEALFWERTDLNESNYPTTSLGHLAQSSVVSVDGACVDAFSYYPHTGWQTLDVAYPDAKMKARFGAIFFQRYENSNYLNGHRAGGDYLSELIVFTNQLSQAEIASVRSYLNEKWGLPTWRDPDAATSLDYLVPPAVVTNVDLAANMSTEVSVDADAVSASYAFRGDGTVNKTGEGAIVLGAAQTLEPFAGTFNLNAGKVYVRGGTPPPIRGEGGATLTAEDFVDGDNDSSKPDATRHQAAGGVRITKTTGGAANTFTKAGKCPAVVSDVAGDVERLVVAGGELTLGKPANVGYRGEVYIANGDFEAPYHCPSGDSAYSRWAYNLCSIPAAGSNNWYYVSGSPYFQRVGRGCTFADGTPVETATTATGNKWQGTSAWNLYTTVGNGNQILNLQGACVYTKVTLPTEGCYELSFDLSERYSYEQEPRNARPVVVKFGTNTSDWKDVAMAQGTALHWQHVKMMLPKHAAGDVIIGFQAKTFSEISPDCSVYIDNVRLRYAATAARDTYAIPNGDFEEIDLTWNKPDASKSTTWFYSHNYFSLTNKATGWTFGPMALSADKMNPYVGLVNPNIGVRYSSSWYPTLYGAHVGGADTHGVTALLMVGATPTASTTFTPPAGTWKLRQRLLKAVLCGGSSYKYIGSWNTKPTCDAAVTIGDTTTPLGRITLSATGLTERFQRYDYPTSFTTDGTTPVTLTLSTPDNTSIAVLVDDLELVGEGSIADKEGELVKNGDFEQSMANWQYYTPYVPEGAIPQIHNGASVDDYLSRVTHNYGALQYTGRMRCMFKGHCGLKQDIAFPAAGRYRLRFGLRSRTDLTTYADGYFAVKIWQGTTTNQLVYMQFPYQCNFTERTYYFDVSAAGTYTLGFETYGPITEKREATCFVDGVSVCRVDWDLPEKLSLNEEAVVSVAADNNASLNLAFTGTNVVRNVRWGGKSVGTPVGNWVIVNRETCPKLVSGIGTLAYPLRGLILLMR